MPSYIYKISSHDDKLHYYGITTQTVQIRIDSHIKSYYDYKNKIQTDYCHSFIIFHKYGTHDIIVQTIEQYDNIPYQDLLLREKYYIQNFNCVNFSGKNDNFKYFTDIYNNIIHNITYNDIILHNNDQFIQPLLTILGYTYYNNHTFKYNHTNIISHNIKHTIQPIIQNYFTHFNITQYSLHYDINYILNQYNLQLLKKPSIVRKIFKYKLIVQPLQPLQPLQP